MRSAILTAVLLAIATVSLAADGLPEKIKLRGEWNEGGLRWKRVESTDPEKLRGDGVAGYIQDHGADWFRIGPIRVDVVSDTEFRDLDPEDMVTGRTVKVRGTLTESRRIEAEKIRPTTIDPEDVQFWGVPGEYSVLPNGTQRMILLGVPAELPSPEEGNLLRPMSHPDRVGSDEPASSIPEKIKLRGEWSESILHSKLPESMDPKELRGNGVAGYIQDHGPGWFRIGPIRVDIVSDTEFRDLGPDDLVPGRAVKVRGEMTDPKRIAAEKIRPTNIHREDIQLWGEPGQYRLLPDGKQRLVVLGVPATLPESAEIRLYKLFRRPWDVRPDEQTVVEVLGRPLTIGGEFDNDFRTRIDQRLEPQREDDDIRFEQELKLELLYEWSPNISVVLKGKASYQADLYREDNNEDINARFQRDETWIYFSEIFGTGFSLQIGRQDFRERLNWWWDQDVDGIRLHFDTDRLHLEAAVARNMSRSDSSDTDRGDPDTDRALRVLTHARWKWRDDQWLEFFFLFTDAHIGEPRPGSIVSLGFDTEPEPELHWLGGRLRGKSEPTEGLSLRYHLQAAWVEGHESYSVLDDTDDDLQQVVIARQSISVSGWGVDGAVTWQLPDVTGQPALTLGGAVGSADEHDDTRVSGGFRQTNMQSNAARIAGVNRIRYYGELFRPGLSNMAISTAMLTARFWEKSSLELAFHTYHQLEAAPFVSDTGINTRPGGEDSDLGFEMDVVLGIREWENIDFQVVFALFRAGDAYGDSSGQTAELIGLSFEYGF